MKSRNLILVSILMFATAIRAGEAIKTAPISLSELALKADLVALAQVRDTDYVYARSFPNEGSAFLKTENSNPLQAQ